MKKLFISLIACVILMFSTTVDANQFILLQLEDKIIPMYCDDRINLVDNFSEVPVMLGQEKWSQIDPSCTTECEMYRGWTVGPALCIELYIPKNRI